MLSKVGIRLSTTISDNDLKYILWRSYQKQTGSDKDLIGRAADMAMRYRNNINNVNPNKSRDKNSDRVNEMFNEKLQEQIDGTLPNGYVYSIGRPSDVLLSAGIPNLPIELRADKLALKSSDEYKSNHPFRLKDVVNLPQAINNPIAIFDSKNRKDVKVILTEIQSGENNFVVALQMNRLVGNLGINSIRSIYPKDYVQDIYNWIDEGLLRYVNKEKAINFISNSSTPANVDNETEGVSYKWVSEHRYNSDEDTQSSNLLGVTNIIQDFENPPIKEKNISDLRFREPEDNSDVARSQYEKSLKGKSYKYQESYQDSMLSLKNLQDAVQKEHNTTLEDSEDAYTIENQSSSKSAYESAFFNDNFFDPLMGSINVSNYYLCAISNN